MTIHSDGNITTLWTEAIPLQELGGLEICRASTIEFNATTQQWEVRFSKSTEVVFRDPSRAKCIAWEVEELNRLELEARQDA
jgi:hypothetical protein